MSMATLLTSADWRPCSILRETLKPASVSQMCMSIAMAAGWRWQGRSRGCHPAPNSVKVEATMRAVIQRVTRAQVSVNGELTGKIADGLLVLLGVARADTEADAQHLAEKIVGLRIFEDENGKMNLAVADAGGAILVVSQFTLYGDVRRGKRPSFDAAAPPARARELYEYFVARIRAAGLKCETGRFQEMMQVELVNQGPVTILLDSAKAF